MRSRRPRRNRQVEPRRRRWLRRIYRLLLWTPALVALVGLGAVLALELPFVRRALTERLDTVLRRSNGLGIRVRDWSLHLLEGRLEVKGLELLSPEGAVVVGVEEVEVEATLGSLLEDPPRLTALGVRRVVVDPSWRPRESTGGRGVAVDRFEVVDARTLPATGGSRLQGLVDSWWVHGLALHGSHGNGKSQVSLTGGSLVVAGEKVGDLELRPVGRLRGGTGLPFVVESLEVVGRGLRLVATGEASLGPPAKIDLDFDVEAQAGLLFPDLKSADPGPAHARGRLQWEDSQGAVEVKVHRFPAEVLQPLLGPGVFDQLGGPGTWLDARIDLAVDSGAGASLRGEASGVWRRGEESLLEGTVRLTRGRITEAGVDLRSLAGEARLWARDLPLEVAETWLGAETLAQMQTAGSRVEGELEVRVEAEPGVAQAVAADLDLVWKRDEKTLLEASIATAGAHVPVSGSLELSRLPLRFQIHAQDLPAEVAAPWVPWPDFPPLVARSVVDLDLRGSLDLGRPTLGRWQADGLWRRGRTSLGVVSVKTVGAGDGGASGVSLDFSALLLPGSAAEARAAGTLRLPAAAPLSQARLEGGRVIWRLEDTSRGWDVLRDEWPELFVPDSRIERWRGSLDGTVELQGQLLDPGIDARVEWHGVDGSRIHLEAAGGLRPLRGELRLGVEGFDLSRLVAESRGRLSARATLHGSPHDYRGEMTLDARDVELPATALPVDTLHAEVQTDGRRITLTDVAATSGGRRVAFAGSFPLERPLREGDFHLTLELPESGVQGLELVGSLREGVLDVESRGLVWEAAATEGCSVAARVPLADLVALADPGAVSALGPLWGEEGGRDELAPARAALAAECGVLNYTFPGSREVTAGEGQSASDPAQPEGFLGGLQARDLRLEMDIDLHHPAASSGALRVAWASLETADKRLDAPLGLEARLARGRLELETSRMSTRVGDFSLSATLELDESRSWDAVPGSWMELAERITANLSGTVDAALLNPFLGGGVAKGPIVTRLTLAGPPGGLNGEAQLDATGASVFFLSPYVTKFEDPVVTLALSQGDLTISSGRARLNDGEVEVEGTFSTDRGLDLGARFQRVRYRLDYGLSASLSGHLDLSLPPQESEDRGRISGDLVLEQGLVRRDIDLEREILGALFAPPELRGGEESIAHSLDLDLTLRTEDGVRVKNNVADLRALWSPLRIRGTLAEPRLQGRIEAEPGGYLYAYGQTLRLEEGAMTLSGLPGAAPSFDFVTTSTVDDPVLQRPRRPGPLDGLSHTTEAAQVDRLAGIEAGFAGYLGAKIASTLGESIGIRGLNIRPTVVFGETDPDARLTVSQDLTLNLALAVAINMRNAERRTYLLDLHDLRPLPNLTAQVFTNEEDRNGATVQHTLELGGANRRGDVSRLDQIQVRPPGFSTRALRVALGLETGEVLPEGALFDAEVEATELLRRQGYSGARVTTAFVPSSRGPDFVHLDVSIDPGVQARFSFEGDLPPKETRAAIRELYRSDFYEPASLAEVQEQTRRALKSVGYLEPEVVVEVIHGGDGFPPEPHRVTVRSRGGRRVALAQVVFPGLGREEADALSALFEGRLERVELATGGAGAESRLLSSLVRLGYPRPRITARQLSSDGRTLRVDVDPGRRRRIAKIGLAGVSGGHSSRLLLALPLAPGEPMRSNRLAQAVLVLEEDYRDRGYPDVQVETVVTPLEGHDSDDVEVTFRIQEGEPFELAAVRFQGLKTTRSSWARHLSELETGKVLSDEDLARARRRFQESGVFSTVFVERERGADGEAAVRFGVVERPRYTFGYGLRWENEDGGGVVVDFLDRNLLGRGIALGVRGLVAEDEDLARIYTVIPHPFGKRFSIESSAQVRTQRRDGVLTDTEELALQLSVPFRRHFTGRIYGRYLEEEVRGLGSPSTVDRLTTSPFLGIQLLYGARQRGRPEHERGLFASLDLSGSGRFVGNDSGYLRLFGQVNSVRPVGRIGSRTLTWAQSYRLGLAETSGGQFLNESFRFFAGGEFSVRGYATEGLGPLADSPRAGVPLGGEALLVLNQELRMPLWREISGVVFLDAGNVWLSPSDFASGLAESVGLGLRADTPLGLLRLDLAHPLEPREGGSSLRVYVGFGQIF